MRVGRERFLGTESALGHRAVKTVKMTAEDLGHDANSVGKAAAGSERAGSSPESSSVCKVLSKGMAGRTETVHARRGASTPHPSLSDSKKLPRPPGLSNRPGRSANSTSGGGPSSAEPLSLPKAQVAVSGRASLSEGCALFLGQTQRSAVQCKHSFQVRREPGSTGLASRRWPGLNL